MFVYMLLLLPLYIIELRAIYVLRVLYTFIIITYLLLLLYNIYYIK